MYHYDKIIKNKNRVLESGEVFTPKSTVNKMLKIKEIFNISNDINTTFFEPSAGEGSFVLPILDKKMDISLEISSNIEEYNFNVLYSLTRIYGIELLKDNLYDLRKNEYNAFVEKYYHGIQKFNFLMDKRILKSAKKIILLNMIQGDSIKGKDEFGKDLIFNEWLVADGFNIKRKEEFFINNYEQMNLFDNCKSNLNVYPPISIFDLYKQD